MTSKSDIVTSVKSCLLAPTPAQLAKYTGNVAVAHMRVHAVGDVHNHLNVVAIVFTTNLIIVWPSLIC